MILYNSIVYARSTDEYCLGGLDVGQHLGTVHLPAKTTKFHTVMNCSDASFLPDADVDKQYTFLSKSVDVATRD